jgi:hypothetical protein
MSGETEDERARRLLTRKEQVNLPKRFYKQVSVTQADGGYEVQLDGRPVRTPLKRALVMPGEAMAKAVADEWQAQETHIDPGAMIITRLANTAIDRVAGDERRIAGEIVQFSASDMVCYRADAPDSLVARQAERWDPVLDWAHRALGSWRRREADRGAARQGQADRARAARSAARRRLVRGIRHVRRAPLHRFRHGGQRRSRRRRGHRLGHGQRPPGLRVRQDFTVFGGSLSETHAAKICKVHGHGAAERRTDHRPVRCRRRAHPGRRGLAGRLW